MAKPNRSLIGKIGAYSKWARIDDRVAATEPGRRAFMSRFEREVDPEGKLPEAERLRRSEFAKKAYYTRLALQSAKARERKRKLSESAQGRSPAAGPV